MRKIFLSITLIASSLTSCCQYHHEDKEMPLASMQVLDRNGFSETVSSKERLKPYRNVNFLAPQPYKKVLRVFGKTKEGQTRSVITTYHDNGYVWQYLDVIDGRAQGDYREWYADGTLKIEAHPIEGVADLNENALASWVFDKESTVWDEGGHMSARIHYSKGSLEGDSLYFYPSGVIEKRIPYVSGNIHGSVERFNEHGELIEQESFQKGTKHGRAFLKGQGESLAYDEMYEEGKLLQGLYRAPSGDLIATIESGQGERIEFEADRIKRRIEYQNGAAEGRITTYDAVGRVQTQYTIKEGMKDGQEYEYYAGSKQPKLFLLWSHDDIREVKTWYKSGTQESFSQLAGGRKHGECISWYADGSVMLIENYTHGKLEKGTYFKLGEKKPISKVLNGNGTATIHDADGRLVSTAKYEKGAPILEN